MNAFTLAALALFVTTLAIESLVQARFWKLLSSLHPKQHDHIQDGCAAKDGSIAQPAQSRHARRLMLYLRDRNFRLSLDRGGAIYCNTNRDSVIFSYWATAVSGCILLAAIGIWGW